MDEALKAFASQGEPASPLDAALKEFASSSALDNALRAFAAEKKAPPPWAAVKPPPGQTSEPLKPGSKPWAPVSPPPAQETQPGAAAPPSTPAPAQQPRATQIHEETHLLAAVSYIADAESSFRRASKLPGEAAFLPIIDIGLILTNAAIELDEARSINPEAKVVLKDDSGEPYEATIDYLAARVLAHEGAYKFFAAQSIAGDSALRQQAYKVAREAAKAFRGAIEYRPYHIDYQLSYARTLHHLGDFDRALSAVQAAVQLDPTNIDAIKLLNEFERTPKSAPTFQNKPPPKSTKPINYALWLTLASVVVIFVSAGQRSDFLFPNSGPFLTFGALFIAVCGCVSMWSDWRTSRAVSREYEDFKVGVEFGETEKRGREVKSQVFNERYRREKKDEGAPFA